MSELETFEFDFGSLDNLLKQTEALENQLRNQYPEFYRDVPLNKGTSLTSGNESSKFDDNYFFSNISELDTPAPSSNKPDIENTPQSEFDEDNLQAYLLRRKFEKISASTLYEKQTVLQWGPSAWFPEHPESLNDEELFLYALTKYAAGISDEAGNAVSLMERRQSSKSYLHFLPIYTALENNASRKRISDLSRVTYSNLSGNEYGEEMASISRNMLNSVIGIINEAEALQAAGYRNRQEALQKAVDIARQRVDRLRG